MAPRPSLGKLGTCQQSERVLGGGAFFVMFEVGEDVAPGGCLLADPLAPAGQLCIGLLFLPQA